MPVSSAQDFRLGVNGTFRQAVTAVPEEMTGPGLGGQLPDDVAARPRRSTSREPFSSRSGGQGGQRVVQPPPRGTAQGPDAF